MFYKVAPLSKNIEKILLKNKQDLETAATGQRMDSQAVCNAKKPK
jgi:hypothetical protein